MEKRNHKYFTLQVDRVKPLFNVSAFCVFHDFDSFCKAGINPVLEVGSSQEYNAALGTLLLSPDLWIRIRHWAGGSMGTDIKFEFIDH
jgi:hypothetical protein